MRARILSAAAVAALVVAGAPAARAQQIVHDPRQHAVSLAFVVPVSGDCNPTQDALDLAWYTPAEAVSEPMRREMTSGHDRLIRLALASVGVLP